MLRRGFLIFFFVFSADTLSCTDRYESGYGDVLSKAVAGVARLGIWTLRRSGRVGEGRRKRDGIGSSVCFSMMFVVNELVRYERVGFHEMNEEMNDVPSFHETDRLASHVEFTQRIEAFSC